MHVTSVTRISADRLSSEFWVTRERSDHDCADRVYFVLRGRENFIGVRSFYVYPEMGRSALAWGEIIPEGCWRVRPCHAFAASRSV